ncbi:HAD-like domain-containing protein [Xylaria sp. CBS 124048]|nr:HAD-like domain-containing protein [Xylaria sp. CBS 124048]
MSRRFNFLCVLGLSNIGRANRRLIRNYSNASPLSFATETRPLATEPLHRQAADSIAIMAPGRAGYMAIFNAPEPEPEPEPAPTPTPESNNKYHEPRQQNQPTIDIPTMPSQPPSTLSAAGHLEETDATTTSITTSTAASLPPHSPKKANRDVKVTPSKKSGGIPDPTPEYFALASHPPFLLPQPRNMLVVIDMNGTLLHRPNRRNPTRFVERPFARPFLSYCVNTFKVVIWSSARPENVQGMCSQLLSPEDKAKLVAVWGRDSFQLSKEDYNRRVQCYKRLTALWNDPVIAASHPMAVNGEKWSQLNTVLVDDSLEKARTEPYNLIQIPDFQGDTQEPGLVLPQVHDYLNACSQQSNISAYMKSQPFQVKPEFTFSS